MYQGGLLDVVYQEPVVFQVPGNIVEYLVGPDVVLGFRQGLAGCGGNNGHVIREGQ